MTFKVNLFAGECELCDAPVAPREGSLRSQLGIRDLLLRCAECEARYVRFHEEREARAVAREVRP